MLDLLIVIAALVISLIAATGAAVSLVVRAPRGLGRLCSGIAIGIFPWVYHPTPSLGEALLRCFGVRDWYREYTIEDAGSQVTTWSPTPVQFSNIILGVIICLGAYLLIRWGILKLCNSVGLGYHASFPICPCCKFPQRVSGSNRCPECGTVFTISNTRQLVDAVALGNEWRAANRNL